MLAGGNHPDARHDGSAFPPDDPRIQLCGTPLANGYCGALCEMRADLLEIVTACGFKTWQHVENPCFCCSSTKANLFQFPASIDGATEDWTDRTKVEYEAAILDCMVSRQVDSQEDLDGLLEVMSFGGGFGGLALDRHYPALGLRKGHRLLEHGPVTNIHDLTKLTFPCTLHFFDSREQHTLNHICPLLLSVPGFSFDCIHLDAMHILDLGVTQYLVGAVLGRLITENFAESGAASVDRRRTENLFHLRRKLRQYYKAKKNLRGSQSRTDHDHRSSM